MAIISHSRSRLRKALRFAAVCACALPALASAADVWVVTDLHHPLSRAQGTRVIELDAPARIEAALSVNLPADPTQARAIVQRRLTEGGNPLQHRLAAAYQDVVDAWSLGITHVPAVVVDQRYVVYGETDVAQALALIDTYRRAHP